MTRRPGPRRPRRSRPRRRRPSLAEVLAEMERWATELDDFCPQEPPREPEADVDGPDP